jgi:hypothetical protein
LLVLLARPAAAEGPACPVEFTFDTSHAALLLEILEDDQLTAEELEVFLQHPVTADALRKTRSYGLDVDEETLAGQLRQLAAGEEISDISFGLGRYGARKDETLSLVQRLDGELPVILQSICARLATYVPPGYDFQQSVVVLSAVNSSGFTFDDPDRIYLVAESFRGDFGGFADLVVHESFHAIQSRLTRDNPWFQDETGLPGTANSAMRLLAGTVIEGTATHVADPIEAGNEGAMRNFQYTLAQRYRRDMPVQFTLFDTTLFRAFGDPDVDYYELHRIGLEGNEAFYHVGALMTKAIADSDGPESIPAYFLGSPVVFFRRYLALSSLKDSLPGFSPSTITILNQLEGLSEAPPE